jgi:undecaprenyl phosphate-alpha-L-ara4N flippase subunit ArnE
MKNKKYIGIPLMLFCAACLCLGPLVWKLMPGYNLICLLSGFAIYAVGALSMIFAYRCGELSVLQPINSMSYVFATALAIFVLHEKVPPINIIGVFLIITGVFVIGFSSK